jgi:hypothetical protein
MEQFTLITTRKEALTRSQMLLFWSGAVIVFLQAYRVPAGPMGAGLDSSFPHILNLGASTGAKFGTDIVYTYGPLGFLLAIEDVGINLPVGFAFWTITYAAFAATLSYFVVSCTRGWRTILGLVLAAATSSLVDVDRLLPSLVMLLLFLGYEHPRFRDWIIAGCGALASLGMLMKVTVGIGCIGAVLLSSLVPFTSIKEIARRAIIAAISSVATFCVTWTALSGSVGGMTAYFYNTLQLSAGYTDSMGAPRADERLSLTFYLLATASLAILAGLLPRWRNMHALAVVVPFVAIAWKHGVVRYDGGHVFALVSTLAFSSFCTLILHLSKTSSPVQRNTPAFYRSTIGIVGASAIACLTVIAIASAGMQFIPELAGGLTTIRHARDYSRYRQHLAQISDARLADSRLSPDRLNQIGNNTVDVYSYELGFVAANPQVNWHLKPIFQHFNAFTENLDRLNADFLQGSNAPTFVMLYHPNNSIVGVDGSHQLFDDPIAFVQLMRHYRTSFAEDNPSKPPIGLLERASEAENSFGEPMVLKSQTAHWNEAIPLPQARNPSSILRVKVDLKRPFSSKVKQALFRLSRVHLVYILADGTEQKYRLIPPHLKSGVWIAPLFDNYPALYRFLGGSGWSGPKVVAIRFESDNSADYDESFAISWEEIPCENNTPCQPEFSRLFSAAKSERVPVLIRPALEAEIPASMHTIGAIDVRLSTYRQINQGVLTLTVSDERGAILGRSRLDAALVHDNEYAMFAFDAGIKVDEGKATLKLSYEPIGQGIIAAWRTSPTAADLDFRAYGN